MRAALFAGLLALVGGALLAAAAEARPRVKALKGGRAKKAAKGADPARWFATRQGLIRVYEERSAKKNEDGDPQPAGASCEVVESQPAAEALPAQTREVCTMIVGKKPKLATALTYELRKSGVFLVKAETAGKAQPAERMLLPGRIRVGSRWNEPRAGTTLARRVKSAGKNCKVERREFGDCLVVAVVQKKGSRAIKRYTETYAAGVGLVEDAQWRLVDVQGL